MALKSTELACTLVAWEPGSDEPLVGYTCIERLSNPLTYPNMKPFDACMACQTKLVVAKLSARVKELEDRPSPLLECISCHNTESPAGAMARYFNHGRCAHCAGYFKVVRG